MEGFFCYSLVVTSASSPVSASPRVSRSEKRTPASLVPDDSDSKSSKSEQISEAVGILVRSMSVDVSQLSSEPALPVDQHVAGLAKFRSVSHSPPRIARRSILQRRGMRTMTPPQIPPLIPELGCQPIFSNSTVSLTSICLNEEIFDEDHLEDTLVGDANQIDGPLT